MAWHSHAGQCIYLFMAVYTTLNRTLFSSEEEHTPTAACADVTHRRCGTSAPPCTSWQLWRSPTLPMPAPLLRDCLSWCQSCCELLRFKGCARSE
jgi:hypothetical protein